MKRNRGRLTPGFLEALRFFASIAVRVGVSLFLGFLAGFSIDSKFGTQPWFSIIGFFIGLCLGGWSIYDIIKLTITTRKGKKPGKKRRK